MPAEKRKKSPKRKSRGPYKQYSFKGHDSGIPRRTFLDLRKQNNVVRGEICNVSAESSPLLSSAAERRHPSDSQQPSRVPQSLDYISGPVVIPIVPGSSGLSCNNSDEVEEPSRSGESRMLDIEHLSTTELVSGQISDLGYQLEEQCEDLVFSSDVDRTTQNQEQNEDDCFSLPDDSNNEDEEHDLSEEENFRLQLEEPFSEEDSSSVLGENTEETRSEIQSNSSESEGSDNEDLAMAPNLNLSLKEKIKTLLLLATIKRHNLSFTAAETIMKLSSVLSGTDSEEPYSELFHPSRHILKSVIEQYSCAVTEHHLCPLCHLYIGKVGASNFRCPKCNKTFNTKKNRRNGNMFLYMPLRDQLKALLEHNVTEDDFVNGNTRKKIFSTNYEDIFDGKMYKENVPIDCISITIFIDGVQIATTCKKSAWPILVCVNELKLHLRRKYILMVGLWLNRKKPNMKEYLRPFIEECVELAESGVSFKRNSVIITTKVKPLMVVSDSIARPLIRNSHQFNGKYGCGLCIHPGIRMMYGRGKVRSYSLRDRTYPLRTHEQTMQYARQAELSTKKHIKGIKGVSAFAAFDSFDVVRCIDMDSFHCLVNVGKRFYMLWFGDKFKGRSFNVANKLKEVDSRLLAITPTCNVSRFPRSLEEYTDYRGHEWYYWIIIYSVPCLKNILPPRFLNHWCLLVNAVVLLMQNSVSKSEVAYADRYLNQFVSEIDNLYGSAHVTFSVHLLSHLARSTEDFSQPWTHSAFIFESFNADIKKMVKSSNGAALQIIKGMQLRIALKKMECDLKYDLTSNEERYLKEVTSSKALANPHCVVDGASLLGDPVVSILPPDYILAMRRSRIDFDASVPHPVFDRCRLNGEVLHSTQYSKAPKQNNSVVLLDNNRIFIIKSFVVLNDKACYIVGNFIERNNRKKLSENPLSHIIVLKEKEEGILRSLPVNMIQSKLLSFIVKLSDQEVLRLACVNVLEMEMLS